MRMWKRWKEKIEQKRDGRAVPTITQQTDTVEEENRKEGHFTVHHITLRYKKSLKKREEEKGIRPFCREAEKQRERETELTFDPQ